MATMTASKSKKATIEKTTAAKTTAAKADKKGAFFGKMYAFNNSLKLYHWHVSGKGSYAQHMALDQALEDLGDCLDRIVETSYAVYGDIDVMIPETAVPANILSHAQSFYNECQDARKLFGEDFTAAIIDDYQEAIQQLLYRLKRLQ